MTVSEAGTGSTASYDLVDGRLVAVSGAIPDTQAAPCWLALSQERSRRLRRQRRQRVDLGVRRRRRGGLTLVDARAGEVGPGSRPLDLTLDAAGRHLYAADRGNLVVAGFDVAGGGALEAIGAAGSLPAVHHRHRGVLGSSAES